VKRRQKNKKEAFREMIQEDIKLMKGNEAIAEAAVRAGCDGYFGYPITPQSEILETLTALRPWETTGMVVLQTESEIASINMVYGAACTGKRAMTSSASPGISLMTEGLSYLAGAELPCLVVNVGRGGPGLGTIQPGQSDYFQAVKAAGHGDFHLIVLAPNSVQEMYNFVFDGFDLAFKYRNPVMILTDGVIGQMMEKVVMTEGRPRWTDEEIKQMNGSWVLTGKTHDRARHVVTSVQLDPIVQENHNHKLQAKYAAIRADEVRYEETLCDDADYVIVAYGSSARMSSMVVEMAREAGYRVGLFRPITLYPFPAERMREISKHAKVFMTVEMSAGQMIEDVRLSIGLDIPVEHFGRYGGVVHTPGEIYNALKEKVIEKYK